MNDKASILLTLLTDVPRTPANIATTILHEDDATLLRSIGLPTQFPPVYEKPESLIIDTIQWCGTTFHIHKSERRCGSVCILVNQLIFPLVLDVDSRAIIFAKDDGTADFVNTGLYQYLYCVGCFLQACSNNFVDVRDWLLKCKECDPNAFHDENSAWSGLFEEAINGMF
jgi:hypothetical protein